MSNNKSCEKNHGWVEFQSQDEGILREFRIEKLKKDGAQWINCDLQKINLSEILENNYDVITVDPPWDIHMNLPYDTLSDHTMISDIKGIDNL